MKKYLIILVLIILVLAGAVYYYLNFQKPADQSDQVACTMDAKICPDGSAVGRQGPKCEFAECPVAKVLDETADWQTYKSDKYGFEFKYPTGWHYNASNDLAQTRVCLNPKGISGDCSAILTINSGITKADFQSKFKTLYEKNGSVSESIIGINGIDGNLFYISGNGFSKNVFFDKNGYVYSFAVIAEHEDVFEKILTTFKFTK